MIIPALSSLEAGMGGRCEPHLPDATYPDDASGSRDLLSRTGGWKKVEVLDVLLCVSSDLASQVTI